MQLLRCIHSGVGGSGRERLGCWNWFCCEVFWGDLRGGVGGGGAMTRMGLWSFTCILPEETPDHEWTEDSEMEQPGTSYDNKANFSYTDSHGKSKAVEFEGRGRDQRVNCSSGGAHMLSCFRAGAINLVSLS